MTITRHRHRRLAVGLAAVATAVAVPSFAAATSVPADDDRPVVTVVDVGDPEHQVLLRPPVTAGTVAETTTSYAVAMSMVGSGLPMSLVIDATVDEARTLEVLSVEDDGAYTARQTITTFDLTLNEASGSSLDDGAATDYSPLVDVPLIVEFDPSGITSSMEADPAAGDTVTPEQVELIEELAEDNLGTEGFSNALPSTPVGEGAVWTVTEAESPADIGVPVALRFTLVSLDGNAYTIDFAIEGDLADYLETEGDEGDEIAGDMTLTGTITGDASSPLDQTLTMDMFMDLTIADDDMSADVDATMTIDHVSTTR